MVINELIHRIEPAIITVEPRIAVITAAVTHIF